MNLEIRSFDTNVVGHVLRVLAQSMTADPIDVGRFTQKVLLDPNFRARGTPIRAG